MHRPNDSRLATVAFVAVLVVLIAVAAFSRRSASTALGDTHWVEHSMRVRVAIGDLSTTLERAVGGDGSTRADVDDRVRTMGALTADNAEQLANVERLTGEIRRAFEGDDAALDSARDTIQAMDLCEERLLLAREARAEESRADENRFTGWGFFAAALGACIAMIIYRRGQLARARVEAELRSSEELHRLLADHASDMVSVRAVNGGLTYSRNAEKILGWRDEELLVDNGLALIHEDDRAMMEARKLAIIAGDTNVTTRFRALDSSGAYRWLESTSTVVRRPSGAPIAIRSATRDVTKQVELEQALRRTEKLYRTMVENAPNAILLFDRDLRCQMAGGQLINGASRPTLDVRGRLLDEWVVPENLERLKRVYGDVLEGHARAFEVRRDDNVYSVHGVPIRDDDGTITGVMSISTDVTEIRRETIELQKTTAHLNALVDNLQFGVFFEDVDRVTRRANHAFAAAHGTTTAEFELMDRDERIGRFGKMFSDPKGFAAATRAHLEGGATVTGETLRCVDGRILERDYVPVRIGGRVIGHLWCMRDVTVLQTAQALLRKQSEELRALSTRDELTGLANRRGLFAGAGELLGEGARNGRCAAVLFADLNGMKSINDTLGHEEGDNALGDAAAVLRRVFPNDAIIARLGGDEFVVLFTAHDHDDAEDARNALRDEILAFNARGERSYRLSISLGLAIADAPFPPLDTLLSRADGLMYEQKRARRALAVSLPPVRSASRTNLIAVSYPAAASSERL